MTPKQKHYFALLEHHERMSFFLGLLKDNTISSYFKKKLVEPWLESVLDNDSPNLHQLYLEAVEAAREAT